MDNIRLNDEGLLEVNPTVSRDQQMEFIDAFRQLQGENTSRLGESAHALGSDLTAPYGGLHGPSEYMKSRYQTPQTESRMASLRTAAQLAALNQVMENEKAKWNNRYNQAYSNAVKSSNASNQGNILTEEIKDKTTLSTLGTASSDAGEDAPYGITRTYAGGAMGGMPLYYDTANAADGSITNNVVNPDSGSTFHVGNTANTAQNWAGTALSAIANGLAAPLAALWGPAGTALQVAGLFGK